MRDAANQATIFSFLLYQNAIESTPEVAEQESAQICTLKRILKYPQSPEN
jgi:hypothetical protein